MTRQKTTYFGMGFDFPHKSSYEQHLKSNTGSSFPSQNFQEADRLVKQMHS